MREINKVDTKARISTETGYLKNGSFCLDRLFGEEEQQEEQQEEYPSHMADLFERIVEIVDNSNNRINIEDNNGNIIADYNREFIGFLREAFPGGHIARHNIHPRD